MIEPSLETLESLVARVADEFRERQKRGVSPDVEEYVARHPEAAATLRPVLAMLAMAGPALSGVADDAALPDDGVCGTLGDFRILREVGRGGMGVVYEAEQISLRRQVALKVLPFASTMDPRRLQRFRNEAFAAASLHHEHIVPVHAVGCERGMHFYAMQFIDGRTLAQVIRARRAAAGHAEADEELTQAYRGGRPSAETAAALSTVEQEKGKGYFREVARIGIEAALALEHAHALGVVHRDVKPGNLMLDGWGKLWVTDFGLARLGDEPGVTVSGDLLGTLRYMSPEQALARHGLVDHRTDVYSLGVTLYELLTLRPAVEGKDRQEVLRNIAFEEPVSPRRIEASIPVDLETVVLKATAKNPRDRYATAKELADDLRRWLEDRAILARRPGLVQRVTKLARRHRAVAATAAAGLAVALAVLAGSAGWAAGERRAREAAMEGAVEDALVDAGDWLRKDRPYEALSAALRAEGLVRQPGGYPAMQPRVDEMLWDVRLLLRLEQARLAATAVTATGFNTQAADEDYEKVFRRFDVDILVLDASEAARRLESRPIRTELVAFLDDWIIRRLDARRATDPGLLKVLAVAQLLDPDERRQRFRLALIRLDKRELTLLAQSHGPDYLPGSAVRVYLWGVGGKTLTEAIMAHALRAQQSRPDDFWLNHQLGDALQSMHPPRVEEAIGFFRVAVALRPQSPGAHLNLGHALGKKGKLDEAVACYREALRLKPGFALAHLNLGRALGKKGKHDEAVACHREAIRLKPDFAKAHTHLGAALEKKGRLDEAIACHREAVRLKPNDPEAHYFLGVALWEKGKRDEAAACFREALRLKPDFADAHGNLGVALAEKGKLDEALACFREALRLQPDNAGTHTGLGVALRMKGRLDEAIACHREALRLKPDLADAHYNLGSALRDKGKLDEAAACYRVALRLKPDDAEALTDLGNALCEKGKLDEAAACHREAIHLKPNYAEAHSNLGVALWKKGRLDEAVACHREAVRLKPEFAEAHNGLGTALAMKGREDEAVACYREAVRLKPEYAEAHSNLGHALWEKGKLDEAVACHREAVRLKPNYAEAHCNLGAALMEKGQLDEAVPCYREALRLRPDLAMGHYNLGNALSREKGKMDEAIAAYKEAIRLQPNYAEAHCNLGYNLMRQGLFEKALAASRRGHELGSKQPGWAYPSAQWVREAERLVELDRMLPSILRGDRRPTDAAEAAALAKCVAYKQKLAAAARLYADAFAADPKLAEPGNSHRYNAACAAAQAAAGQGLDAADLDTATKARWRRQGLTWLRSELAALALEWRTSPKAAASVRERLEHWRGDPDLASVRDKAALAKLGDEEGQGWARLWTEVDRLASAGGRPAAAPASNSPPTAAPMK